VPVAEVRDHGSTVELTELVASLPVEHREVLVLCGMLGYDYDTAAQVLDVPVGTVRSRLSRARQRMAARLEPPLGDSESA
jgi:RNA polymerase sigma-70 factor (ECF subfamily)